MATTETGQWKINKLCPWCGGKPEVVSSNGGQNGYNVYVRCINCHASNPFGKMFVPWDKQDNIAYDKAAAAWDKRA